MRRLTWIGAAAAALGLAVAAAGCGGGKESAPAATETGTTTAAAPTLKVGLITDLGQLDDNGFNELAYNGLKRAQRELGVQGRVVESKSAADYVPNMAALVRQDYDLIVSVGFAQGDAVDKAAQRFPGTKFAIVDVSQADLAHAPANVQGLLFREEQVGYLVGFLAALEQQRRGGKQIVSAVGGFKEPPVDRFIAGYRAGAERAVPGMSSTPSISPIRNFSWPGRTGAKPTPQLPMTSVVTPCQHEGVSSGSQVACPS